MEALIEELAKKYKDDHKLEEDAAKEQIAQKLTKTKSKSHGTTVRALWRYYFIRRLFSNIPAIARNAACRTDESKLVRTFSIACLSTRNHCANCQVIVSTKIPMLDSIQGLRLFEYLVSWIMQYKS